MSSPRVSIVIPVLNDSQALATLLPQLQCHRQAGHEVVVVDGGSRDGSMTIARKLADRVLISGPGRSRQMNLGAENTRHDILLFLHADSGFPEDGLHKIQAALPMPACSWGRFDVTLDHRDLVYRLISTMMNWRSRVTGIATGDQGIFVRKPLFHQIGGFRDIPLMEDIALSKDLRSFSKPVCLPEKLLVSARRWQQNGVVRTVLLMWYLRLGYFMGRSPHALADIYYPSRGDNED